MNEATTQKGNQLGLTVFDLAQTREIFRALWDAKALRAATYSGVLAKVLPEHLGSNLASR